MAKHLAQHNTLPSIHEGLDKKQIVSLAKQSVDTVLEEGNAFQVAEAIAVMEEFVKQVRKDDRFVDFLRDELVKYNGAYKALSGAHIEMCEAGVIYDYSEDATWKSIDNEIKELTRKRKEVEAKLRSIAPGKMMVDHETGEVMIGALKSSKSTYRITLSK